MSIQNHPFLYVSRFLWRVEFVFKAILRHSFSHALHATRVNKRKHALMETHISVDYIARQDPGAGHLWACGVDVTKGLCEFAHAYPVMTNLAERMDKLAADQEKWERLANEKMERIEQHLAELRELRTELGRAGSVPPTIPSAMPLTMPPKKRQRVEITDGVNPF